MRDFTKEALRYARIGWRLFPLAEGAKLPAIKGGHGVKDSTSCGDDIRAWGRLYPRANIGVACGSSSGIVVIDIDPRNGGTASLAALAAKGRALPIGPRARTGNGGAHHVFRFDERVTNSKGKLGPGVDIKSTGGYVVVAPSWIAPSTSGPGGSYVWEISPFDVPLPCLPIWLTTILCPPPRSTSAFAPNVKGGDIEPLARFVAASPKGERNNRLHWAACRVRELVASRSVPKSSAVRRLSEAAAAVGLPAPEALRTIFSGLQRREPRPR